MNKNSGGLYIFETAKETLAWRKVLAQYFRLNLGISMGQVETRIKIAI